MVHTLSVLLVVCALSSYGLSQVIPTTSTANSETYDTASVNHFKNKNITCTKALCQVICDETGGCSGLTIYGSLSNILQVTCSNQYSCSYMNIIGGGQTLTNITCSLVESCDLPIFNVSNSATVDLNCYSSSTNVSSSISACTVAKLYAETSSNVNVYCGYRGCSNSLTVHAESVSNGLYLNCDGDFSCNDRGQIYCPESEGSVCDITCSNPIHHACYDLNVFIKDKSALPDLQIVCGQPQSCYLAKIWCGDNFNSPHSYLNDNANTYNVNPIQYSCGSSDCCPWLYCKPSEECIIDCETRKCDSTLFVIDGSMASKLTVNCNQTKGGGCAAATILCPEGGGIETCTINCADKNSCFHVKVDAADKWFDCNGECPDEMFFYCNDASSSNAIPFSLRKNEYDGSSCPWPPTLAPTSSPTEMPTSSPSTPFVSPTVSPVMQTNDTFKWRIIGVMIGLMIVLLCFV